MAGYQMTVACDAKKQDDGSYVVMVSVSGVRFADLQTLIDSLREPVKKVVLKITGGVAGPVVRSVSTGEEN